MDGLELSLLGSPKVSLDGQTVHLRRRAVALLAYLAVTGRPQHQDVLARLLAGAAGEAQAQLQLGNALAELRDVLDARTVCTRDTVALDRERLYRLDVDRFERCAAAAAAGDAAAAGAAAEMYGGEFLAGFTLPDFPVFEDWLLLQREHLQEALVESLLVLLERHLRAGTTREGLAVAWRLIALEPWREEAHRALMALLARAGQPDAALAQYAVCRRALAEELGVAPSRETTALDERLRAGPHSIAHNLPAAPHPLVGREAELPALVARLAGAGGRLVTLVGPDGSGKTDLALAAAHRLVSTPAALLDPAFPDGVFFVPLDGRTALPGTDSAALTGPSVPAETRLAAAIGRAAGVAPPPDARGALPSLRESLRDKRLLLILDGAEVSAATAEVVSDLLRAVPGLKVVVTARGRLGLPAEGETVLEVTRPPADAPAG